MTIGERIKSIRLENGMTQKELGEKCGIADSAIRRYELGGANPKTETLQKIATALNVSIYRLTGEFFDEIEKSSIDFRNINGILSILEKAGYKILRTPCFFNQGDWQVKTIVEDNSQEKIKAAFNEKLQVVTRGCSDFQNYKQLCKHCENDKHSEYVLQKDNKKITVNIDEMTQHINDIVRYTDFLFSQNCVN